MKTLILPVVLVALAGLPGAAVAQQRVALAAGAEPTPADRLATADLVRNAATMIANNYVFPDTGRQTAAMLSANLASGDYDGLDAQQLADALSQDLREFTEDLHFGARWMPPQPDRQAEVNLIPPRPSGTYGVEKIERLEGNIGYLDLRGFQQASQAAPTLHAAMKLLQGSDAIIFDLRRNGGGDPETVQLLCSYLFDPSEPVHLNSLYFRPADRTTEFWTTGDLPGQAMPDTPVYVLTSSYTFSAAEEFTYNLQTRGRATIVGENTGGGAHPVDGFDLGDGIVLRIPVGRAINPITNTNWEGAGIAPDVAVAADDALDTAQSMALQSLVDANPEEAAAARWALDSLRARTTPVSLSAELAAEYVGTYGDREIRFEQDSLQYRRTGVNNTWRPLVGLGNSTFLIEGVSDFRMVFERADGEVTGIRGQYRGRPSDFSKRD